MAEWSRPPVAVPVPAPLPVPCDVIRQTDAAPGPSLTEREREVLHYLVKGFTGPEIGRFLGISGHTVASHVKSIYRKLEVRSRGEVVYEAMQLGLVKEEDE
jgi:DNA-binding CsgD family transcriptional regulator